MSNFGCSTRLRNEGFRNQSRMNAAPMIVMAATIQSITGIFLSKERVNILGEQEALISGEPGPGWHGGSGDAFFESLQSVGGGGLLLVEVGGRGGECRGGGSIPISLFAMTGGAVFGEKGLRGPRRAGPAATFLPLGGAVGVGRR